MPRPEPSKLPLIIAGGLLFAAILAIIWQEIRYVGATDEIDRLNGEVSRESIESRQNLAALELASNAYQAEAAMLRSQLAQATADRPLDHLQPFGGDQDLKQCRQTIRDVFDTRVMPLARQACANAKPDPALQAAWKAIDRDAVDWGDFFRPRIPGFGPGCFVKVAVDLPAAGRVDNDIYAFPDLQSLVTAYCVISPDRNLCLYLDYPTGQPDSSARLWDLKNNREVWKFDCGPGCHWDYAVWLDPATAAVIGLSEAPYSPLPVFTPEVRLVQFKGGQMTITAAYRGPDVDVSAAAGGASYAEQLKKWISRNGNSRAQ